MIETMAILSLLGGPGSLKIPKKIASKPADEICEYLCLEGLPVSNFKKFIEKFSFPPEIWMAILGIKQTRTYNRRLNDKALQPDESNRFLQFLELFKRISDVLGSEESAELWLLEDNGALAGEKPLNLLNHWRGYKKVEEVLGRLEWGMVS